METHQLLQEEPAPNTEQILKQLSSRKPEVRAEAEARLQSLGAAAAEEFLRVFHAEGQKRRKRRRIGTAVIVGYFSLILGGVLLTLITKLAGHPVHFPWEIFNIASYSGGFVAIFAVSQEQKAAARAAAQLDDVRCVGMFAEALYFDDKALRAIAEEKLIALLPRMQATDASLVTDEQRKCLSRALSGKNPKLILAILKAFEQIGGEAELPAVQRLAEGESAMWNDGVIRDAAQACLPMIEERVEREKVAHTLLRAAESPAEPGDVLLRPASGAGAADSGQLLRPAASGGES